MGQAGDLWTAPRIVKLSFIAFLSALSPSFPFYNEQRSGDWGAIIQ
jgi:hypothetical protein